MARWPPAASTLRAAFIVATSVWAVSIVVAPFLASRAHASAFGSAVILGVYGVGSLVCHQLPERSYQLWSAQMPVCARCAGIYVGAVAGSLSGAVASVRAARRSGAGVAAAFGSAKVARLILALAVLPTLATLVYEWSTGVMPSHSIRAAAGVAIGVVVAWLVVAAADNQVN
jgi:hypothetical protein